MIPKVIREKEENILGQGMRKPRGERLSRVSLKELEVLCGKTV